MKISESTYEFLTEIKDNNNKIWFDTNKKRYISARNEFIDFLTAFMLRVNKFETLPVQDPAKCLYRIYRDVRFSPNKEPYKSHMAAIVSRGGQPKKCMFYIHLQAGETFVGGGMYDPAPEVLKAIRQEIHYNGHTLESLISSKSFKSCFGELYNEGKLKKAPKGYDPAHPHIELLKYKHYLVGRNCKDEVAVSEKFMDFCVETYKASMGFYSFIDGAVLNAESEQK